MELKQDKSAEGAVDQDDENTKSLTDIFLLNSTRRNGQDGASNGNSGSRKRHSNHGSGRRRGRGSRMAAPFVLRMANMHHPTNEQGNTTIHMDRRRPIMSVIASKKVLVLDWINLDAYDPTSMHWVDHQSFLDLESDKNKKEVREGISLTSCLNAFTKEEQLEEADSWYCPNCKTHRSVTMKTSLWKTPDILVIHIKRFHCSARWREKIRTLVHFPHSGLEMAPWVCPDSTDRPAAARGPAHAHSSRGHLVYDLFGVVNHVGGMTGGHYTAFCRSVTCTKDGVEEVGCGTGDTENLWLHFDDEFVEEISADKVVSEAAYVLFYRKRRLTPSNVISMTV